MKKDSIDILVEYDKAVRNEKDIFIRHSRNNNSNRGKEDKITEGLYEIDDYQNIGLYGWEKTYRKNIQNLEKINEILDDFMDDDLNYFVAGPMVKSVLSETLKIGKDVEILPEIYIYVLRNKHVTGPGLGKYTDDLMELGFTKYKHIAYAKYSHDCKIYVISTVYETIPSIIMGMEPINRICYYDNKIMVSKLFILEVIKYLKISELESEPTSGKNSTTEIDPYLKLPRDVLNMYNKSKYGKNRLKVAIDTASLETLRYVTKKDIKELFVYGKEMVSTIEYAIIKHHHEEHPILRHNLRSIIQELSDHHYLRDPVYLCIELGMEKNTPELFRIISGHSHKYSSIVDFTSSKKKTVENYIRNINRQIIRGMIVSDDAGTLRFIKSIGYLKKVFGHSSKKGKRTCDMIVSNKSNKIIDTIMTDPDILTHYKMYLIMMTGNISLKSYLDTKSDSEEELDKLFFN